MTIDDDTRAFTVRELDASTWDAFAELVERNGGIFGGCGQYKEVKRGAAASENNQQTGNRDQLQLHRQLENRERVREAQNSQNFSDKPFLLGWGGGCLAATLFAGTVFAVRFAGHECVCPRPLNLASRK